MQGRLILDNIKSVYTSGDEEIVSIVVQQNNTLNIEMIFTRELADKLRDELNRL